MLSSIQNRLKVILFVAMGLVLLMGGITLIYFARISEDLEMVIGTDIRLEQIGYELRPLSAVLIRDHGMYLKLLNTNQELEAIAIEVLSDDIQRYLASIAENFKHRIKAENKAKLIDLQEKLRSYLKKIEEINRKRQGGEIVDVEQIKAELSEIISQQRQFIEEFLTLRTERFETHQGQIDRFLNDAQRNIVFILSLAILAVIFILFLAPQRVVQPIKNYINAIRELRDLKFDVRVPVNKKNELAELGVEINAFINAFVQFDKMKVKKIQFEKRKLQVLTDMLNLGVVVISIEGYVLFMNSQMSSFLKLNSEDYCKKDFHKVRFPEGFVEIFEDAILKKEKFENRMIILTYEKTNEEGEKYVEAAELLVDAGVVRNDKGNAANIIITFEDISNATTDPKKSLFHRLSFFREMSA